MDIKIIYDYLNELSKCEWHCNAIDNGIKYNGIEISQGVEYYQGVLSVMHEGVEKILVELSASGQNQILQALYGKVKEIYEQPYDVITIEAVEALKRDVRGNMSPSVKAEIELGYFVVQMHGVQMYYQHSLLVFISNLLGVPQVITSQDNVEVVDSVSVVRMPASSSNVTAEKIVKGVGGLARYLGIGNTKAQEILNSRILQKHKGTAYLTGKGWRINTEKLDELIADNPEIFKGKLKRGSDL